MSLNALTITVLVTCICQLVLQVRAHDQDVDELTTTGSALGNLRIATWIMIVYILLVSQYH